MKNKVFNIAIVAFIAIVLILIVNYMTTPKEGELIKINYKEISEKIEKKDSFILVVSQSTCSHCATYRPKLMEIAKDYGIDIYYIDFDLEKKKEEFLKEFHLSGASPITMFIENGKEKSILNRLQGDLSTTKVVEKFKEMGFIE